MEEWSAEKHKKPKKSKEPNPYTHVFRMISYLLLVMLVVAPFALFDVISKDLYNNIVSGAMVVLIFFTIVMIIRDNYKYGGTKQKPTDETAPPSA